MRLLNHCPPFFQALVPQHALSRFAGWMANCQFPPLKNYLIRWFIDRYHVNMEEAVHSDPESYADFNSFFIRTLKEDARYIDPESNALISPVDGVISQLGTIQSVRIFQAKGFEFNLLELMGGKELLASPFQEGHFAAFYLAPKDYHRVHMPITGTLISMTHVPGQLFSVNSQTTQEVANLFARNERLICVFETAVGKMAIILVGAMIVASIHTAWAGEVTPAGARSIRSWNYAPHLLTFEKGHEMGYFKLGSTVILLFEREQVVWQKGFEAGDRVKMGECVGTILSP